MIPIIVLFVIFYLLSNLVSMLFGCWVQKNLISKEIVGTLNMDRSIPDDPPYIFLELNVPPDYIFDKEYVYLRTDRKNYISQK